MARFNYSAILDSGKKIAGVVRSPSRRDALKQLLGRGCHPLSLELEDGKTSDLAKLKRFFLERITTSDLAIFTKQMASLIKAGLPMTKVLVMLRSQSENRRLSQVIEDVEESLLCEGSQLSEALSENPKVFSPVYTSLVKAGEEGGNLVEVLQNLSQYLSRSAKLRGQVVGALIYPIFLLLLGITAIFVLMVFVIPRFQELFESFGQALPLPTQMLISLSSFMSSWWWVLLIGFLSGFFGVIMLMRKRSIRKQWHAFLLRGPIVGKMLIKLEISRMSRTLGALLCGGVDILAALQITGSTVQNLVIGATFPAIIKQVSTGEGLAVAAEKSKVYPPLMLNLIRTGEETGELPEMLTELSLVYEEEAERAISGAVKLIEPIFILVVGTIIAGIVAAIMLPIFQANAMVQ